MANKVVCDYGAVTIFAARLQQGCIARLAVVHCDVRLSVCLSVAFLYSVETDKHIVQLFSPSGRATILVFPRQTLWQYSDGDPLTRVKIAIFDQYLDLGPMTGIE